MGELAELIRTERLALIEFLETLGPEEWSTPSLCGAWTVQEVAAHLAWAPVLRMRATAGLLARARFDLNRASAEMAIAWSGRGTTAILGQLRDNAANGAKPLGVPQPAVLTDAVIHQLDIRLPLGKPRQVPREAFAPVADFSAELRWPMSISVGGTARKRIAGLRLVADGYDWCSGDGPEVHAGAETMLKVLTGRRVDRSELAGPGADQLFARINRG
jgi:uncharacterized protein (TIGR03083 family)